MEKRQPTLADKFIARRWTGSEAYLEPKAVARLQAVARQARKFAFDEAAMLHVAHVVQTIPELLVREYQFARPPFEQTWIEFPGDTFWQKLSEHVPEQHKKDLGVTDETMDLNLGFLIDHGRVNVVVQGRKDSPNDPCILTPLQYHLNTEWPVRDQLTFATQMGVSRLGIDPFLWGSTYDRLSQDERRLLRDNNMVELVPFNKKHNAYLNLKTPGFLGRVATGSTGELRTVVALLLLLNRPSITRYVQTLPNSRGWNKNRVIPYLEHTRVTIDLDAVELMRKVGTSRDEGTPKRRHEVRGHYCHDKDARDFARIAGCIHDFQPTTEDWLPWGERAEEPNHWLCATCGGKRWWKRDHVRGDASLGFVKHEGYDVTV
jgi:hypothetical protein